MQEGEPAQTALLIRAQLAGEARRGRQGVGGFLLVVLLEHRLQPGAGGEGMHGQALQGFAFVAGDAQGIVEVEGGLGGAKLFGVFEIKGPQLDPGAFVLHQWAALRRQLLQIAQVEGDAADHELPAPLERLAEGEAPGFLG